MREIIGKMYLTEKEAARRYGYSTSWFQSRRNKHLPPTFMKISNQGKVYYPLKETDDWFQKNIITIDYGIQLNAPFFEGAYFLDNQVTD